MVASLESNVSVQTADRPPGGGWAIECCVCHQVKWAGAWGPNCRPGGSRLGFGRCPDCATAHDREAEAMDG